MDVVTGLGYILVSLVCIMLSTHVALCFVCWIIDVIDKKSWRYWK